LRRGQARGSPTEAAALASVSARPVQYTLRVLRDGSAELIAAVESGAASPARLAQPG